eukprot:TRINITY_DN33724_c0_g1_i1.p2 TRINITY_DN33724_c0_g1~~TRINITY_DN33724_c0_g1_i1.p2  ORF type:complete len:101 (+),score=4.33 TRINITY_DN33724_c0_g1_i1:82-384(+)
MTTFFFCDTHSVTTSTSTICTVGLMPVAGGISSFLICSSGLLSAGSQRRTIWVTRFVRWRLPRPPFLSLRSVSFWCLLGADRSAERRVGHACSSRWSTYH